ncbi:hypothetical protein KIW84_025444 [Lathyrus oleraceus]|uniref:Uncharacterized protein n=1 Tax=Pisum sativum TaxID=3888 RepID=A0A9D4YKJ5_PEA|nr:hypothetical protein KIW84_025444 [Pisum sativum]
MEEYLVKMKNLGDKLKLAGAPMSNFDLTIQTLKDLDLDYNSVVVKLSDQINLSTGPVKHEYSILDKVPVPGTHTPGSATNRAPFHQICNHIHAKISNTTVESSWIRTALIPVDRN